MSQSSQTTRTRQKNIQNTLRALSSLIVQATHSCIFSFHGYNILWKNKKPRSTQANNSSEKQSSLSLYLVSSLTLRIYIQATLSAHIHFHPLQTARTCRTVHLGISISLSLSSSTAVASRRAAPFFRVASLWNPPRMKLRWMCVYVRERMR